MSKYIIELEDDIKYLIINGRADNRYYTLVQRVADLEVLNSDYINEHFGDLQDEAYLKGLREGKKAFDLLDAERDSEYQRGLDDAWEAARKIVTWPDRSLVNSDTFDLDPGENIFTKYSASAAIAKLKAYEEKQKADEIKAGDEVISNFTKTKGILLEPETEDVFATIIVPSQRWRTIHDSHDNLEKTGKHYDIEKFLEEMKE